MSSVILGYYYRVYVPTCLLSGAESTHVDVQKKLDDITRANGGVTLLPGTGAWYDTEGKEVLEPVTVATWWFSETAPHERTESFHSLIDELVHLMFAAGEYCIAVEYHSPHNMTRMEMRTPS